MEYKLPPLPETEYGLSHYDEGGTHDTYRQGYSDNQMQAYAIAAIEAQGVPDGLTLAVIGHKHFGNPIPQAWYAAAKELLASAPPAPQSEHLASSDPQAHQQAITDHAAEQASVVQQEPVAWRTFDGEGGYEYRALDRNEDYAVEWAKRNPKHAGWVEPLYTHPAQQTRPQPLSDEKVLALYQKYGTSRLDGFTAAIRDAEAAHGIQGS